MSSPIRRTNSRSTPSRSTPNGFRRSQADGYHSPYRGSTDSPTRLIEEFSKVYIDDEKAFRKRLDEQADEQERLHRQALAKSLKEHEEIRQSAERARERLQLEIERMKAEKAASEQIALEAERLRAAEAEAAAKQRELEAVKRSEEALRLAAQKQREVEEAQQRIEAQRRQEDEDKRKRENERIQKEEAEKKRREEAAAKEHAEAEEAAKKAAQPAVAPQQPPTPAPQTNGTQPAQSTAAAQPSSATEPAKSRNSVLVPGGIRTPLQEREAEHKRYLDLHKQLKVMRTETLEKAKQIGVKNEVGDMRREVKKSMGQMVTGRTRDDKLANQQVVKRVKQILLKAAQMQQIMIDVTPYIVSIPAERLREGGANTQYPAILLFLLNHLVKAVISQFAQEVSRATHAADPIGILVVSMFSTPELLWNGHSLIDILWAKYHKVCPVVFGIYGSEKSAAGRTRLGWHIEDGAHVDIQEHQDRMIGFGAGFGAITLRDFTKSKNVSPAPVHLFWTSLARILNTPKDEQSPTQYVVLNSMLKHCVQRFISFYGTAAIAALRTACIDFPSTGPAGPGGQGADAAVVAVQALPRYWQKELNFTL